MRENIFKFEPPIIGALPEQNLDQVIRFTRPAFGTSNWSTRANARPRSYYFNLDQALGSSDGKEYGLFLDNFARHIRSVIEHQYFVDVLSGQELVLGYVCPAGAPAGIVQLRSGISQRLKMASVLIFPEKRLLRSRVICDGNSTNFPESVKWLSGRHVLLLTDATTTGDSLAHTKGVLSAFGASVLAAVAVYDREEGAVDSLKRVDIALYPVYRATVFAARRVGEAGDEHLVQKIQECTKKETIADLSPAVSGAK